MMYRCAAHIGRGLGVHGLHRRDILRLDWCVRFELAAVCYEVLDGEMERQEIIYILVLIR